MLVRHFELHFCQYPPTVYIFPFRSHLAGVHGYGRYPMLRAYLWTIISRVKVSRAKVKEACRDRARAVVSLATLLVTTSHIHQALDINAFFCKAVSGRSSDPMDIFIDQPSRLHMKDASEGGTSSASIGSYVFACSTTIPMRDHHGAMPTAGPHT